MEAYIVLVKLLCAHFISDFALQTNWINRGKSKAGFTGIGFQALHAAIHSGMSYLFVAEWSCWIIPVVIFITHFIIDVTKYNYIKPSLTTFLIDQLCHVGVIVVLWNILFNECNTIPFVTIISSAKLWIVALAYILMLKPSSILLGMFLEKWTPTSSNAQSLPNAGQWIGYIERILILTFVLIGSMEGVGFLLAAKSVFRFGELNKAKEIRTTEYVLIGTLASFTIAILTGIAVSHLL
ncbi:MAG: DUF3307 domain-containing protein [Bacteroidaceae bacterium]|nr:DUF3307 domain-containing protein [Bacteroidaceae bacterium]